jgi:hypothetical protein
MNNKRTSKADISSLDIVQKKAKKDTLTRNPTFYKYHQSRTQQYIREIDEILLSDSQEKSKISQ